MQNFAKKKKKKGFTLIELLVVIAIIGILATIVIVNVNSARQKAKAAAIIGSMDSLRSAAEMAFDSTTPTSYASTCLNNVFGSTGDFGRINAVVVAQGAGNIACGAAASAPQVYAAWATTTNPSEWYCVDSAGRAQKVTTQPTAGATACQ